MTRVKLPQGTGTITKSPIRINIKKGSATNLIMPDKSLKTLGAQGLTVETYDAALAILRAKSRQEDPRQVNEGP